MPKQVPPLTHTKVKNLKPGEKQKEVSDGAIPGFGIRVSKTGKKTWFLQYRVNGRGRRMSLGTFPELSLADARDEARDVRGRVQKGEDPQAEKKRGRTGENSFEALAEFVLERKAQTTRESTARERRRIFEKDLKPAWGDRPAGEISRWDVSELLQKIVDRGAPAVANRTLRTVKLFFNEGLRHGFPGLEANPAHMLKPPAKTNGRDRYLSRKDLKAVWQATEPESPITRGIFRLTFLTAQRVGAVRAMRRDMIDDANVWRIPPEVFKSGRPHLVPLSPEALEVLESVPVVKGSEEWVFPGRSDGSTPHVSSTNSALRRVRERTEKMGVDHWVLHDARRTFRTWASHPQKPDHPNDPKGLGIRPEVADAVLGHKEASVGRSHYQGQAEYYRLGEKREALRRWGAFVMEAVEAEYDDE